MEFRITSPYITNLGFTFIAFFVKLPFRRSQYRWINPNPNISRLKDSRLWVGIYAEIQVQKRFPNEIVTSLDG